jgi:hypothetical protein
MNVPILFAHGEGMFKVLGIALGAGFIGTISLVGGIMRAWSKAEETRREARYFFAVAAVCLVLVMLAPALARLSQ